VKMSLEEKTKEAGQTYYVLYNNLSSKSFKVTSFEYSKLNDNHSKGVYRVSADLSKVEAFLRSDKAIPRYMKSRVENSQDEKGNNINTAYADNDETKQIRNSIVVIFEQKKKSDPIDILKSIVSKIKN